MAGNLSVTRVYDRIFSIARDEVQPNLFDNISARTAYLFRLKERGAIIKVGGQPHLRFNILKELPTTEGYSDLDTLTPVRGDPVTSAIFEWKQFNTPVQISGRDMIKTGEGQEVDLLTMFLEAAEVSMRDAIGGSSVGLFSDAGESELRKITGLANILTSSTNTGTVGNLSRATLSAWRHQSANVSSDFSANGINRMRTLFRQCSRFDESPDTIVLTGAAMDLYELNLTSTFRVNLDNMSDSKMLEAGFSEEAPLATTSYTITEFSAKAKRMNSGKPRTGNPEPSSQSEKVQRLLECSDILNDQISVRHESEEIVQADRNIG